MEFLFHTAAGWLHSPCCPWACNCPDLSIWWQRSSLAFLCFMLRFWSLILVLCWISFPTPIHMLHSDLGCENHTTSKNEDFHQILAFSLHHCNVEFSHSSNDLRAISAAAFSASPLSFVKSLWFELLPKTQDFPSHKNDCLKGRRGSRGLALVLLLL